MVSGEWAGTMCLTEANSGTDLGLLRTKATPRGDGSYAITGTKIYISAGEHDLTNNIIHLVLARTPDGPPGTKGISLFVVPKFLPDADGKVGPANGVNCGSIEQKMGIHASPTCVMHFNESVGWLLGKENEGLSCMFTMMNHARLGVGLQGQGVSELAWQASLVYAMRPAAGPLAHRRQAAGQARRPDHRAPGHAAYAAHAEGTRRGWPGACLPDRARDRRCAHEPRSGGEASARGTWWRSSPRS